MIKKVEHIGVAVSSIEKSIHVFRDMLGIPMERMYESEAIKTKIAFFPLEGCTIELIEPMDPESPAAKFIQKRGEGIHHVCLGVENIEEALREYEAKGIQLLNKTPRRTQDGRLIAFLNPKSTHGVLIELEEIEAK
jgi:methylmalonyl-CoA/ethylmalonyl-CoA epimerase